MQNANESFNGILWSKIPKSQFVGNNVIELGAHSALIHYIDGMKGILAVLDYFGSKGMLTERLLFVFGQFPHKLNDKKEQRAV